MSKGTEPATVAATVGAILDATPGLRKAEANLARLRDRARGIAEALAKGRDDLARINAHNAERSGTADEAAAVETLLADAEAAVAVEHEDGTRLHRRLALLDREAAAVRAALPRAEERLLALRQQAAPEVRARLAPARDGLARAAVETLRKAHAAQEKLRAFLHDSSRTGFGACVVGFPTCDLAPHLKAAEAAPGEVRP